MAIVMLRPVVALALWTLLVLGVLAARRLPALRKSGIDLREFRGARGQDFETMLAGPTMWPSHNYTHLVEQPTLFYAIALVLAVAGDGSATSVGLGWAYVALRVAHSVHQIAFNVVTIRFLLFALSTVALLVLTLRALILLF